MIPNPNHWPPISGIYVIRLSEATEDKPTYYYGGRAKNCSVRWTKHLLELRKGQHHNQWVQRLYNKHGVFEPSVVVPVPSGDKADLMLHEQVWLDANYGKPGCVNLARASDFGGPGSVMSDAQKSAAAQRNRDRVWTEESRQRSVAAHTGKRHTAETKKLMSDNTKAATERLEAFAAMGRSRKGVKQSEAFCQAISDRMKGNVWSEAQKATLSATTKGRPKKESTKQHMREAHARKRGDSYLLTPEIIYAAADVHRARVGRFPHCKGGDASADFGFSETWNGINNALRYGLRGLSPGSSLSKLLKQRGLK